MTRDPYADLPQVRWFSLSSDDIKDGKQLPSAQRSGIFGAGGEDVSPALSWSGFPEGTKSFAVTVYDPDAPTASGFWHWAIVDLPSSVTSLPAGAGDQAGQRLPSGAFHLRNDGGLAGYLGAAPPPGHGPHQYHFVVHAVDVPSLGIGRTPRPRFSASICSRTRWAARASSPGTRTARSHKLLSS